MTETATKLLWVSSNTGYRAQSWHTVYLSVMEDEDMLLWMLHVIFLTCMGVCVCGGRLLKQLCIFVLSEQD